MLNNPRVPNVYYRFDSYLLDASRQILYKNGKQIQLAPRVLRGLLLLVQNCGRDLSKTYLMDQLWPDTMVEENSLTVVICALRKILGETPEHRKHIVTIPGQGYRFVANVVEMLDPSPEVLEKTGLIKTDIAAPLSHAETPASAPTVLGFSKSWRRLAWMGSASLSLALVLILVLGSGKWWHVQAGGIRTVAVLPIRPLGANYETDYLGLGMTDNLIVRLRNVRQIAVRPISDVLRFRNAAYDPRGAAGVLNVDFLLTGTVQRHENTINVQLKLLRSKDAVVLWSEELNGSVSELLAIQDRIADHAISALMQDQKIEEKQPHMRYTSNADAYELFLRGQYFLNSASHYGAEIGFRKAVAYFQQAVEKDPQFALAYAELGTAYNKVSPYSDVADSMFKAEEAEQKALSLDDHIAEAHRTLALAKEARGDLLGAEAAFRRSLELDPGNSSTHRWYADILVAMGRGQEAESEVRRAQELDPPSSPNTLGYIHFYSRRYAEAFHELQGTQDIDSQVFWYLIWMDGARQKELVNGKLPDLPTLDVSHSSLTLCELGYADAMRGRRERAEACLMQNQKTAGKLDTSPYNMALLCSALGDKNRAFHWLNRAREEWVFELVYITVDPRLDNLRSDPRFDAFVKNLIHVPADNQTLPPLAQRTVAHS